MREIEVKAKIDEFELLINKLKELGCSFSEPITQKDTIYMEKGELLDDVKPTRNVFRIRKQTDKSILTLKRAQSGQLDCIERESIVSDSEQVHDMLSFLGYEKMISLTKTRRKCKVNGYEVCLDEVEELGKFIEVEKISDEETMKVQEELLQFLLSLGIKRENRVFKGYDVLLYHSKQGNNGNPT